MLRSCPCWSELRYAACCGPYHEGVRSPEAPVALMRSRFSAFALGLGVYLVDTLAADHEDVLNADTSAARAALARALGTAKHRQRFLGLRILDSTEKAEGEGEVFFRARIFERGVDRSFYELSRFQREPSGWRYRGGDVLSAASVPEGEGSDPTVERFKELLRPS